MTDPRDLFTAAQLDALDAMIAERIEEAIAGLPNGRPWLTVPEAAAYVGASARTIQRRIRSGDLRVSGIGRRRIIARGDLDALLGGRK